MAEELLDNVNGMFSKGLVATVNHTRCIRCNMKVEMFMVDTFPTHHKGTLVCCEAC